MNSRYEDAEVNEEELGKLKIHKKGKEDKLVVIFHAGLGSIDEFLPFIQGLCNEEKGTIVSIALNNVKQYLDFYAGHLYESVADKYTKIILDLGYDKIQLIGHCVGGMIAFEVAKNMMDKGVDVIDVSLIDSIPGKYSIEDEVVMELMFLPMVNITYPVLAEYQLNERELYEYMDEKFGKYTGIEQKSKNKVEEYKDLDFFKKYVVAEDWEGFKKAMEESNIRDKELILRVLAMYSDPEVREREIKNISSAYSVVAEQILPKLRRSKFVVNAERIGKSDEEIRNLAKSNPSALNVEELLYAATLFDNNGDKLAIYEAAMRQFPNDWRGFNDAGMILFETGKVAQAKADFEKANALSANNKTIKNNLGAVELINGNVKEAEVLFGAATGAGNEVNYNKGIVAIMKGDYKAAVDYFGKCNCVNAALANILAGNNNEAAKKLNEGKDDSALASYLKAVIAARNNDNSAVLSNLKTACSKDASMKKLAATDMEFAKLFDNADFQAIVK